MVRLTGKKRKFIFEAITCTNLGIVILKEFEVGLVSLRLSRPTLRRKSSVQAEKVPAVVFISLPVPQTLIS